MSSRFEDRLRSGPPIVADGGMGALISGAVPRLRCPEEANLRAPESVVALHASFIRAGAELIETNTFGANRRKLAGHYLEDEFERINSSAVRLAREAREVSGADVYIAGSIGPIGDVERFDPAEQSQHFSEQAQILEGRGVDLFMVETFFDLDELVAAIEAVRGVSSLPIVALMTFDDDGQTLGGVSAETRPSGSRARRGGDRREPRRRPAAALNALAAMQRDGLVARRAAERRPRQPRRRPRRLPARDARVLRRVRRAGAAPRRRDHRRLLRHDAGADRGHPRRDRRGPRPGRAARRARARARRRVGGCAGGDGARPDAARAGVRRLGAARPAARREQRRTARGRPRAARVGRGALRRRQRQPTRPRPHERRDGVGRDRAGLRDRDDPAPDHARHVRRRAGVAPPRRARRGRAQHPRGHRRPARGRRLPRRARRLRGRRDRADAADRGPEPRRGLPRPRHRRPHVVLHRRRRQPVRRRPRARAGALRAQARGGRAVRDDADPVRPRATSTRSSPTSAAARRSRCSSVSGRCRACSWRVRLHNEVPGIVVPEPRAGAPARRGRRTRPRWARRSRAS